MCAWINKFYQRRNQANRYSNLAAAVSRVWQVIRKRKKHLRLWSYLMSVTRWSFRTVLRQRLTIFSLITSVHKSETRNGLLSVSFAQTLQTVRFLLAKTAFASVVLAFAFAMTPVGALLAFALVACAKGSIYEYYATDIDTLRNTSMEMYKWVFAFFCIVNSCQKQLHSD